MEKHLDEMRIMLQLADTGLDAIQHLIGTEGEKTEQAPLYLLPDLVDSFLTINKAFELFCDKLPPNGISEASWAVSDKLTAACQAVEDGKTNIMIYLIRDQLLPVYKSWRQELADCFNPYILS
ncbi:MAG: hypothetical protein RO469_06710 [Thermincola sp.]|jgi:hypothetical protein|nr:hypothetical protein [Thermincola sp.]MDT3703376.1 hypothetical protein [Thermincola sp.]